MRNVGPESRKTYEEKLKNGFFEKYMSGAGVEVGYKSAEPDCVPILPDVLGVDFGTPGYDGLHLPVPDNSQSFLYSSHCLEHITDYKATLKEWFRVLKPGGHLVIVVPHMHLYEKKTELPSRFNADHKRFYTASSLCKEIEDSLEVNSFRIRHLKENDAGHVYADPPEVHGKGQYELEIVVEKL